MSLFSYWIPVIAGAGSNDTKEAISQTNSAAKLGADAALHVMGYYNRPDRQGILFSIRRRPDRRSLQFAWWCWMHIRDSERRAGVM